MGTQRTPLMQTLVGKLTGFGAVVLCASLLLNFLAFLQFGDVVAALGDGPGALREACSRGIEVGTCRTDSVQAKV